MEAQQPQASPAGPSEAQPADGVPLDHAEVDLVAKQVTNVVNAVQDHGGPLQPEAPCDDVHILGEAHRPQHLRAEHATVAHLYPLLQLLGVTAA